MTYTHVINIDKKTSSAANATRPSDNDDKYNKSSSTPTLLATLYTRVLYTIAVVALIVAGDTVYEYNSEKVNNAGQLISAQSLYVNNYVSSFWRYTEPELTLNSLHPSKVLVEDGAQSTAVEHVVHNDAEVVADSNKCVATTQCNFKADAIESLYTFTTSVQSDGIHVIISYADTCCTLPEHQPNTYFRVTAIGTALATAPAGVTIPHGAYSTSTVIHTVEYGYYSVAVRVMLHDVSDDVATKSYETLNIDDNEPGVFVNRLVAYKGSNVKASIVRFDTSSQFAVDSVKAETDNQVNLPTEYYDQLWYGNYLIPNLDMPTPAKLTQFCGSPGKELQTGRYTDWSISPGTHMGLPLTLKDAKYAPYDCIQPYTADNTGAIVNHHTDMTSSRTLLEIVTAAKWINFIGDSVTRHLFEYTCIALNGVKHEPSEAYMSALRHCPLACSGGDAADGTDWYVSYSAWWHPLYVPIIEQTDFKTMCNVYNETDVEGQVKIWPNTGWPACHTQSDSIRSLSKPTLTYFGWGSHPSNVGTVELRKFFNERVISQPYFQSAPTLFGLTTAVHTGLIPDKFGRQAIMRNNERISLANAEMMSVLSDALQNKQLATYSTSTNWLPVLDVYSPSYVAVEVTAFDAVHSEHYFKRQAVAYLTNMLVNAPNFRFMK